MKTITSAVMLALTLFLHQYAFADVPSQEKIDIGAQILNFITSGDEQIEKPSASLLSAISFSLNVVALIATAVLTVFGGATYVIQTASKGTPGGQVISSFWAPIRIATSTLLLIPLVSGYSTLQLGVNIAAQKGNSAANYVMSTALDYMHENGNYRPPAMQDYATVMYGWIASEVCAQYINSYTNTTNTISQNYRPQYKSGVVESSFSYDWVSSSSNSPYVADPRISYCGSMSVEIPRSILPDDKAQNYVSSELVERGFRSLVNEFKPRIEATAARIISDQASLKNLQRNGEAYQQSFEQASSNIRSEVESASTDYAKITSDFNKRMLQIIVASVNEVSSRHSNGLSWKDEIKNTGWPAFGAVFWKSSITQQQINHIAEIMKIKSKPPILDQEFSNDTRFIEISLRLRGLEKAFRARDRTSDLDSAILVTIEAAGSDGSYDFIKEMFASVAQSIMKSFVLGDADADMITSLQYSGSVISATAEAASFAIIGGVSLTQGLKDVAFFAASNLANAASNIPVVGALFGAGATTAGVAPVLSTSVLATGTSEVGVFAKALLVPLVISGFTLAVVLPAIPLVLWLSGVLSWVIFYIECLLVSPMWMAAHASAEKDGWGSEHTRQGYMLMIGLVIGPSLRVAGFAAVLVAMRILGWLVHVLSSYLTGVLTTGWLSPLMVVGSALMLAVFGYSMAVRLFSLPNELFEKGLRWINGGQEVTGDEKSETSVRQGVATFSNKSEGAASSAMRPLAAKTAGTAIPKGLGGSVS